MLSAVHEAAVSRRVVQAPRGRARAHALAALSTFARVDLRSVSLEKVCEDAAIPDLDAPHLRTFKRGFGEEAVRDEQARGALVALHPIDELPNRLQVDWRRPTLRLNSRPDAITNSDDVGALVETTNVFYLVKVEKLEKIDDGGLELEPVQAVDSLKTRIWGEHAC